MTLQIHNFYDNLMQDMENLFLSHLQIFFYVEPHHQTMFPISEYNQKYPQPIVNLSQFVSIFKSCD